MSGKEMIRWERPYRKGRREYQLYIALVWFFGFGLGRYFIGQLIGIELGLLGCVGEALLISVLFYRSTGILWDRRTEDYLEENRLSSHFSLNN